MQRQSAFQGLIMDLGVAEGNDTAHYLARGFQVVAVEANTGICGQLRQRFAREIADGALVLLNFAASRAFGGTVEIHAHREFVGISGTVKRPDVPDDFVTHTVPTIDWRTLVAQAGVPRYLKIDIEGSEPPFLEGMEQQGRAGELPEFMSVECYRFEPLAAMQRLGYRRFKLVDQNPPGGFRLPHRQLEGRAVAAVDFTHASGPFGLDVFADGDWLAPEALESAWTLAASQFNRTWYDCHAWLPR